MPFGGRNELIEFCPGANAFHGSHRRGVAGARCARVGQGLLDRHSKSPTGDVGTAEGVSRAGRVDLFDHECRRVDARAVPSKSRHSARTLLHHDLADPEPEQPLDSSVLTLDAGRQLELVARRQQQVRLGDETREA